MDNVKTIQPHCAYCGIDLGSIQMIWTETSHFQKLDVVPVCDTCCKASPILLGNQDIHKTAVVAQKHCEKCGGQINPDLGHCAACAAVATV